MIFDPIIINNLFIIEDIIEYYRRLCVNMMEKQITLTF